ncbi:MAG: glutamate--cysteine ligase [Betaproteobacteria bacterium]|jgi:glutamate--cysteine ligase, T. ferrooxidans family|nr:glutamate--cysteine ligase [Betaproteobacteria bacterium]
MVPHLTTALHGPLLSLEQTMLGAMPVIEHWFRQQWLVHSAPFYASVDLRNAGFKLAPVDTNLFPAGFNNLNVAFDPLCVQAAMSAVEKICPDTRQFLLIPENHTRNLKYLENVATLKSILQRAGFVVRIGSLIPELTTAQEVSLPNGQSLLLEPIQRRGNRLTLGDYDPCAILLNNDLSSGIPTLLKGLSQTLVPPPWAGWNSRRKSRHFSAYQQVATEFSRLIDIDPWLIDPFFSHANHVDFSKNEGIDELQHHAAIMLDKIRIKYREYHIDQPPFVIAKADAGTYGMGIMTIKDATELGQLNRRQRNKMSVIKEGQAVHEVLLQEGVPTFETVAESVAEPVIYLIDHFVVGGFYRVHTDRGIDENLNAPGAHFVPLAFETAAMAADSNQKPDAPPNRFYTYGVVARLALLAAARELEMMATQYV